MKGKERIKDKKERAPLHRKIFKVLEEKKYSRYSADRKSVV